MAGKSKSRWTRSEIDAARMFGTERIPNNGYGQPDFVVPATDTRPQIAVQVKTRANVPAWLYDAMNQATLDAINLEGAAIPAVVIVHKPGQGQKARRFAVIQLHDAASLLTTATDCRSEGSE